MSDGEEAGMFVAFIRNSMARSLGIALGFPEGIKMIERLKLDLSFYIQTSKIPKVQPGVPFSRLTIERMSLLMLCEDARKEGLTRSGCIRLFNEAIIDAVLRAKTKALASEAELNLLLSEAHRDNEIPMAARRI